MTAIVDDRPGYERAALLFGFSEGLQFVANTMSRLVADFEQRPSASSHGDSHVG